MTVAWQEYGRSHDRHLTKTAAANALINDTRKAELLSKLYR